MPLIGSAVRFGQDPINLMLEARKEHGDVFTLKIFHEHMIFFVGAEAQECFFKTGEDIFNAAAAYKFTVPLFGKGGAARFFFVCFRVFSRRIEKMWCTMVLRSC